MCCIHFHVHICSTPPFLPPSLKGKGKLHKHYAAHNCYLKVGIRGPLLNSKYVLHNACVDVPFSFKEGGGNGEVLHICT